MKRGVFLFTVFFLLLTGSALALRIVVLYPAASPILRALGIPDREVVGVTRHDRVYPGAIKVGSHLRPNLELIRALAPDLLIVGSRRAFPEETARKFSARIFRYDPRTLQEILTNIKALGEILGRRQAAEALVEKLSAILSRIKPLPRPVTVIYEVSATPLKVAGARSIVNDLIRMAGGRNLVTVPRKHVLISPEKVLALAPEVYIYQVGPMNRHPIPPKKRPYFRGLRSRILRVEELEFARPGLNAFSAALKLNHMFLSCVR